MTDIERKALALVNEVAKHYRVNIGEAYFDEIERAFYRAIEQHEAFRQEVSEAATKGLEAIDKAEFFNAAAIFSRFIIAKPDPLVEVMNEMGFGMSKTASEEFREALAKRGLEIREKAGD